MPISVSSDQSTYTPPELLEDLSHLAGRLETAVYPLNRPTEEVLARLILSAGLADYLSDGPIPVDACCKAVQETQYDGRAIAIPIGQQHSVVFCGIHTEAYKAKVATIVRASPPMAKTFVEAASEATRLARHSTLLQLQLDASALQIAQSFEEQCWLRDLARNLSISGATGNANALARGILGPMLDLLCAEALFIIVSREETLRSGLASASFGREGWSVDTISALLEELAPQGPSCPVVVNNSDLLDGRIHSLVAVPIIIRERPLGYIVAINRVVHTSGMLGLIDPEFGSVEVGLMEEASVLLSTQTHNIRLVLDSQNLALGTLQAMSRAIDARDPYTRGHSERVARLSFEIGELLGLQETACQEIYVAGILHDVGKIGIPDRVLLKAGSLTDDEFDVIKQHPEIGYRIIEQLGKLHFTLPGVLYHHERWDGGGYPHGLSGEDIPLMARIIAVADSFDAMTSSRPYRQAMPLAKACDIITAGAGKQWDAMLVRCFKQWQADRQRMLPQLPPNGVSLIPQEPPYANIAQSIMALQL